MEFPTASTRNRSRPVKTVSESVRERETFRYDPFLYADCRVNNTGKLYPSSEIFSSGDSILTGLCQLGAYQTQAARSFVSLFDSTHQYVVAEAMPFMSLEPGLPSHACPEPLSLCGVAIPRSHGTCEHVLYLRGAVDSDPSELPLSLVLDLEKDDRLSWKPYCNFAGAGQFYAAVPIRTRKGINIGSYCIMNPRIPESWSDRSVQHLREVSRAIMEHLEYNRSRLAHPRHELIIQGLGSFIEGRDTIAAAEGASTPDVAPSTVPSDPARDLQKITEMSSQEAGEQATTSQGGEDRSAAAQTVASTEKSAVPERPAPVGGNISSSTVSTDVPPPASSSTEPAHVFAKAANIIREAFDIGGCVFLDAALTSYQTYSATKETDSAPPGRRMSIVEGKENTSEATDASCDVLAASTTQKFSAQSSEIGVSSWGGNLPRKLLARLLHRYPNGNIFDFDATGDVQSSDPSDDERDTAPETPATEPHSHGVWVGDASATRRARRGKASSRRKEGAIIHAAFPSARSVVFIPVWDPKRERWCAGGFCYTDSPTRIISSSELSLLNAFAKLVAAEVLKVESIATEMAKSDALGSLSHELRSPLHGVILGTELLNDTDLSVFQGNATNIIETCCRTLLDTIDHLLDYSKINSFATRRKLELKTTVDGSARPRTVQFGKKDLFLNTRLDRLVEEVAESVYAGFSFQHSTKRLNKIEMQQRGKRVIHRQSNIQKVRERVIDQGGPDVDGEADVFTYLSIDPSQNWELNLPAGAIRRIVMNLFGNALKYTDRGYIRVELSQLDPGGLEMEGRRIVQLTVQDTGKGIGQEYLQHKLFRPFSQEDELAPGTGLGLSLVKVIVDQLHGEISVKSQAGVGTTITVTLPLDLPLQDGMAADVNEDDGDFEERVRQLTGMRVLVKGFKMGGQIDGSAVVEDICRSWLHLDIVSDYKKTPDVIIWSEDALPELFGQSKQLGRVANVVVYRDAMAAFHRLSTYASQEQWDIPEIISQPIGPRKLAKAISAVYSRWAGLPRLLTQPRPEGLTRTASSNDYCGPQLVVRTVEKTSGQDLATPRPPAGPPAEATQLAESAEPGPPQLSTHQAPPGGPETEESVVADKILLVDDNPINLKVLCAYMGKLGRAYATATDGRQALDAYTAAAGRYAAVLMDISMPVMDGLEATRRIREFEREKGLSSVLVVVLTGLASDGAHREALRSGVDVFLTKPVRLKALSKALEGT